MSDTVLYEVQGHVAIITLNRPDRLNALNYEAYEAATVAFAKANEDKNVRCIIFTGNGRCFCSGDDVVEIMAKGGGLESQMEKVDTKTQYSSAPPLAIEMLNSRCPIINAVNGPAVGIGIELSLMCDVRIAADTAKFSEMFVKRGIIGTHVSFNLLPNIVGPAVAAEMLLTGCKVDAARALEVGLVSKVTTAEELLPAAQALAEEIITNPPLAVEAAKQALRMKRDNQPQEIDAFVSNSLMDLARTEDHKESVKAFLEKRPGVYQGK